MVAATEASVVIAVSSPHRRDALDAVSFAIDELKEGTLSLPLTDSDSEQIQILKFI